MLMEELSIAPYAPLIQLLAGFYLLSFYESFFLNNPLTQQYGDIVKPIYTLANQYQGVIPAAQLDKINNSKALSDDEWKRYSVSIKKAYLLSFLLCIFMLIYAGSEHVSTDKNSHYALQVVNIGIFIYSFAIWTLRKYDSFIKKYLVIIAYFILLIFVFHKFQFINNIFVNNDLCLFENMKNGRISAFSIATCFAGIFIAIWHITYSYMKLFIVKRRIIKTSERIGKTVGVIYIDKKKSNLPKKIKKEWESWISDKDLNDVSNESSNEFLMQKISEEIDKFMTYFDQK